MPRIADAFARIKAAANGPGLIAYVTAGDPDLARTAEILVSLAASGADVLEVGVPFSDPLADGPVIQRASERALASKTTLRGTLKMIEETRSRIAAPIVLFTYANPILRMGEESFVRAAVDAGVDGVLMLDLPVEEAGPFRSLLVDAGLDPIFLLSPTTTDERIRASAALGRGFLYVISRLGVTGARERLGADAEPLVRRIPSIRTSRWRSASASRGRSTSRRSAAGPTRRWSAAAWSTSSRSTAPTPTSRRTPAPTCAG